MKKEVESISMKFQLQRGLQMRSNQGYQQDQIGDLERPDLVNKKYQKKVDNILQT